MKPFSQACENNKQPILEILHDVFAPARSVLEIGSGTGQHAVYFAAALPHLVWTPSDLPVNHAGIRAWLEEAALANLRDPIAVDIDVPDWATGWPPASFDGVFSANTAHIVAWPALVNLCAGVGRLLAPGGAFVLYGPFRYGGRHTSPSNARFDRWLRAHDPRSGIRDFEAVDAEAGRQGLGLEADWAMPANNRTLVWRRRG